MQQRLGQMLDEQLGMLIEQLSHDLNYPLNIHTSWESERFDREIAPRIPVLQTNAIGAVFWSELHVEPWYAALACSIVYLGIAVLVLKLAHGLAARTRELVSGACPNSGYNLARANSGVCPGCKGVVPAG
ncbi:MAG TPA: hypothetical protein VN541_04015 [Tepidisphaeraceae bacterium]|nr:hypothetical protein [Tepidisphaeraceae bacterium]